MHSLISAIQEKSKLTDEALIQIKSLFKREHKNKGEILLNEGQFCKRLYFLESGTIRSFYLDNGTEYTTWFYKEGSFFSSWYSFYAQQQSYESIEVLEDATVYSISIENYELILNEHHCLERFARFLAQEQVALIDSFSKGYMFLSAQQKYELILQYFPDIEQRVKLGQLASFLGISQETLSRVRGNKPTTK